MVAVVVVGADGATRDLAHAFFCVAAVLEAVGDADNVGAAVAVGVGAVWASFSFSAAATASPETFTLSPLRPPCPCPCPLPPRSALPPLPPADLSLLSPPLPPLSLSPPTRSFLSLSPLVLLLLLLLPEDLEGPAATTGSRT